MEPYWALWLGFMIHFGPQASPNNSSSWKKTDNLYICIYLHNIFLHVKIPKSILCSLIKPYMLGSLKSSGPKRISGRSTTTPRAPGSSPGCSRAWRPSTSAAGRVSPCFLGCSWKATAQRESRMYGVSKESRRRCRHLYIDISGFKFRATFNQS